MAKREPKFDNSHLPVAMTAIAILGVRIPRESLQKLQACSHSKPSGSKFCPECGKPIKYWHDSDDVLMGYTIEWDDAKDFAYVGIATNPEKGIGTRECQHVPDDIKRYREQMRDTLGPVSLWNERSFGLWTISRMNYA